jgi:hypothetical protein
MILVYLLDDLGTIDRLVDAAYESELNRVLDIPTDMSGVRAHIRATFMRRHMQSRRAWCAKIVCGIRWAVMDCALGIVCGQ